MAKTKEEVEEWIKRMDVSLVFVSHLEFVLDFFSFELKPVYSDCTVLGGANCLHHPCDPESFPKFKQCFR